MAEEYNVELDFAVTQFNAINCCKIKLREVLKSKNILFGMNLMINMFSCLRIVQSILISSKKEVWKKWKKEDFL